MSQNDMNRILTYTFVQEHHIHLQLANVYQDRDTNFSRSHEKFTPPIPDIFIMCTFGSSNQWRLPEFINFQSKMHGNMLHPRINQSFLQGAEHFGRRPNTHI